MKIANGKRWIQGFLAFLLLLAAVFWLFDYRTENGISSWRTVSIGILNVHADPWNRHVKIRGHVYDRLLGQDRSYAYIKELNSILFVIQTTGGGYDLHSYDLGKDKDLVFTGECFYFGYHLKPDEGAVKVQKKEGDVVTLLLDDGYEKALCELNFTSLLVRRVN